MCNKYHIETNLVQIGNRKEHVTGAINSPIYMSTAYRHSGIGESTGFDYSRTKNPTRSILEESIALLEGGAEGFAFSSGMAAIHTLLSLFKPGDEIVASLDLYGGTYRLFEQGWKQWGVSFQYFDTGDTHQLERCLNERTRAVFIETPTNPLMQEANMEEIVCMIKSKNILLIVDNTFYTPILQKPLTLGADIVVHSASKYLGGHNDVIAGLVVAKHPELCEKIGHAQNSTGSILSPSDSWLLMRGMKTLALRMERHTENARKVATYLEGHEKVTDVLYPGKGGMLSFQLTEESCINPFLQSLQLISFAESLGGVESFITYPATQTHADVPEEVRIANGISNCLLRFSVGIERAEDIILDLEQALRRL